MELLSAEPTVADKFIWLPLKFLSFAIAHHVKHDSSNHYYNWLVRSWDTQS